MGKWTERLLGRVPDATTGHLSSRPVTFDAIGAESIPASFFGLTSYDDPVAPAGKVSRRSAIQVPAVKRGRDMIAGVLGTLPIDLFNAERDLARSALLEQPEIGIPRSVTLVKTFEDMLFEGVAWWMVTEYGWHDYPTKVKRLDPTTVTVKQDGKVYTTRSGNTGVVWDWVPDYDLIRFDSPNDPLLIAGARAIRASLRLDAAATNYAGGNQPLDYFASKDGYDPGQEELDEFMDDWEAARKQHTTGYVPSWVEYRNVGWNPQQLQLSEARNHATLELARAMGVDPTDLGIPVSTNTYFNAFDRKQHRLQNTLRAYITAFEDRLSMNDVTPRGYSVRLNLSDLLRSDDSSRFDAYMKGLAVGAYEDRQEVRLMEGKKPLPDDKVETLPAGSSVQSFDPTPPAKAEVTSE